jgi:hypothetical protein
MPDWARKCCRACEPGAQVIILRPLRKSCVSQAPPGTGGIILVSPLSATGLGVSGCPPDRFARGSSCQVKARKSKKTVKKLFINDSIVSKIKIKSGKPEGLITIILRLNLFYVRKGEIDEIITYQY